MNPYLRTLALSFVFLSILAPSIRSADPGGAKLKQFIYVLRPVPRLYSDSAWTDSDKAAVSRHFVRFQQAIETGQLILAGRTSETGEKTFGIAIFEAADEAS